VVIISIMAKGLLMIPFNVIQKIILKLSKSISITIIRADQNGPAPAYPYGVYKITSSPEEFMHQNIQINEKSGNNTIKNYYKRQRSNISLSFLGKKYEDVYSAVKSAFDFFRLTDNISYIKKLGVTPMLISPNIQDRSTWLDAMYEYKFGFDFRLDYIGSQLNTIESIEHIEITPKPEAVVEEKIIIDL